MSVREQLVEQVQSVIKKIGGDFVPVVEFPGNLGHGDFATNAAMILAGRIKGKPMELAEEIAAGLRERGEGLSFIDKVEVMPPGFINFWVSEEFLLKRLFQLSEDKIVFPNIGKGKTVIVEYSSPNIAKPFTIGHLRSTIIGDAIAKLFEATGWEVKRDNHVGDWGTQFGKQIYAIKEWGNEEEIEKSERPVKILVDLYVKFHQEAEKNPRLEDEARQWFKKLEEADAEAKRLWQKCVDWSWVEFHKIYEQLGVSLTENNGRGYGESFFEERMGAVIEELERKKLLRESEGARLVFFPEEKYPPFMILKKDGATLYSTRDLATDKFRLETYGEDLVVINEAGAEQALYFQQLYEVEQMLGWFRKAQRIHIKHGMYRFKDEKMSTRKGNVIWLEEVLLEAIARAKKLSEEGDADIAEQVGIGAIKWNDLKRESKQDILFDWGDVLNMQGNSGPYMQYVFARTRSVLEKAGERDKNIRINGLEQEERDVIRLLVRFEQTVADAAQRYAPHILALYLFELAQGFNLFYQKLPILKAENGDRNRRLVVTKATGVVIQEGLRILGIAAPERM